MRKIVHVALFCICMLPLLTNASQVRWNVVEWKTYVWEGKRWGIFEWLDTSTTYFFQVFFDFSSGSQGQGWSLTPTDVLPAGSCGGLVMYKADVGSVVNHDSAQQSTCFVNAWGGVVTAAESEVPWTPLTDSDPTDTDENVYLAIILTDYYGNEAYGWANFQVYGDGNILGRDSAIDLDGGPMIVGGGAWEGAMPEPASGLLLLVGGALLVLRRQRILS